MSYKSTRLLVEAINTEMEALRKSWMGNMALPWGPLNELRDLVKELAEKADRVTLDDVSGLHPDRYVATMKPLVAIYHRQLMVAGSIPACLCDDLQALACVVILMSEDKTIVRAAHVPGRPEVEAAVEAIVGALEDGIKQVEDAHPETVE